MQLHLEEIHSDGAPLYIVPEREIDGFDHFSPGVFLGNSDESAVNALCAQLGVSPLSSFYSQDTHALSEGLRYEGYATLDLPAVTWFSARAGLKTIRALVRHLKANPDALDDAAGILAELREYEFVLSRFEKEGIRWYLSTGY